MKYVMFRKQLAPIVIHHPVIFPNHLVHEMVAANLTDPMNGALAGFTPISAGDVYMTSEGIFCSGSSETLNLVSRGDEDANIIAMNDYGAGLS